uniref:Uncharacterized protein n=1 Tax=Plectus sambesii TaxID=2011161 RepID=A0A914WZ61_9BILA
MMIVLTENLPDCCEVFKSACEDSCCACCDIEEDAGSIYYIPTAGRSMDADTLRQFVNSRYGDSISVTEQYAIPAPPTRHMLLPPPEYLALSQPQILIPDVLPYGRRHNSRDGSIERPVRRNTPDNSGAYRVGPARSSASSTPQVNSPSVQRRSFAAQVDDGRSVEECIYEEPPSLVGSQPVYTTQQVGDDRERDRPVHDRRRHSMYEDDAFSMDSRYQHAHHQDPTIEMRPNWRQYLLDGAIRRHGDMPMGAPIIGMVQHSMPMCLAPAPLLPPPNMGHVIRYPRGLPRH